MLVLEPVIAHHRIENQPDGKEFAYYTIKLTNASVAKIHQFTSDAADTKGQQMEEISLSFQKIEITEVNSKITVTDTPHERQ